MWRKTKQKLLQSRRATMNFDFLGSLPAVAALVSTFPTTAVAPVVALGPIRSCCDAFTTDSSIAPCSSIGFFDQRGLASLASSVFCPLLHLEQQPAFFGASSFLF